MLKRKELQARRMEVWETKEFGEKGEARVGEAWRKERNGKRRASTLFGWRSKSGSWKVGNSESRGFARAAGGKTDGCCRVRREDNTE